VNINQSQQLIRIPNVEFSVGLGERRVAQKTVTNCTFLLETYLLLFTTANVDRRIVCAYKSI